MRLLLDGEWHDVLAGDEIAPGSLALTEEAEMSARPCAAPEPPSAYEGFLRLWSIEEREGEAGVLRAVLGT